LTKLDRSDSSEYAKNNVVIKPTLQNLELSNLIYWFWTRFFPWLSNLILNLNHMTLYLKVS